MERYLKNKKETDKCNCNKKIEKNTETGKFKLEKKHLRLHKRRLYNLI